MYYCTVYVEKRKTKIQRKIQGLDRKAILCTVLLRTNVLWGV
jgi:hypothetical protein